MIRRAAVEALKAARAQWVFTAMTAAIVAFCLLGAVATHGRNAAAEAAVLGSIEQQGPRIITIRLAESGGRITANLVDQLAALPEVEAVVGVEETFDAHAGGLPDGVPAVAARRVYGDLRSVFGPASDGVAPGHFMASARGLVALGTAGATGSVVARDRPEELLTRTVETPDFLRGWEPLLVQVSSGSDGHEGRSRMQEVRLVAADVQSVPLLTSIATRLVSDSPPGTVAVETSEDLRRLQVAISGQMTQSSHAAMLGVLALCAGAVLANVLGFAASRRRDYGRRRALGATRGMLIGLTVGQVLVAGGLGVMVGLLTSLGGIAVRGEAVPTPQYLAALVVLLLAVTGFAALGPALVAAWRDPLRELRVP